MDDFDKRSTERGQEPGLYPDEGNRQIANSIEKPKAGSAQHQAAIKLLKDKAYTMAAASEFLRRASEEIFQALDKELK